MFSLTPFRRNFIGNRGSLIPWGDVDRFVGNFFSDSFLPFFNLELMKVDISENEKEYIVEAEIPGVDKKDIELKLNENMLTIQVQKNEQVNEEWSNYIRKERKTASMSRSFYVENVNTEKVSAKYENGILKVILPKRETGYKKEINIDIN